MAVLLVDTHDTTLRGVRTGIEVARRLGLKLPGMRLDSADLAELAVGARQLLDAAGMPSARIIASGGGRATKVSGAAAPLRVG